MMSGEVYVDLMSGVKASVALRPLGGSAAALLGGTGKVMMKFDDGYRLPNSTQRAVQSIYHLSGSQTASRPLCISGVHSVLT